MRFGSDFTWGVATSAYQIEGAAGDDGREPSIWDEFCQVPGAIVGAEDGSRAADHYHRIPADVALMADLGVGAYRFSISWSRVLHADGRPNPRGIDFYSRLVDELLGHGIKPWPTLYHWDLPASLPGGWLNRDTAGRFADYAELLGASLGDRVRRWSTLNEPWCSSILGYGTGEHAPGHRRLSEALTAAHHLLLGHGLGSEALRATVSGACLGITLNFTPALPADPDAEADVETCRRIDALAHRLFLDPVFGRGYPSDLIADVGDAWPAAAIRPDDLDRIAAPLDWFGVNNYNTNLVRHGAGPATGQFLTAPGATLVRRPKLPLTDMGWEVDPDGFRDLLVRLHTEYTADAQVPMVVTENGAAMPDVVGSDGRVHDTDRIDYLSRHLLALGEAISAGVDVRGYFLWSLLDNFEWALGYGKRFGIVRISENLDRVPKDSADFYAQVCRSGEVSGG